MALYLLRLRGALSISSSVLNRSLHFDSSIQNSTLLLFHVPSKLDANAQKIKKPFDSHSHLQGFRYFRSSPAFLFTMQHQGSNDDQEPIEITLDGQDFNHWLVNVRFPEDEEINADQMVETYIRIASKVFGSVEEAKKRIYSVGTNPYTCTGDECDFDTSQNACFAVECDFETSEKFREASGVGYVMQDFYVDPINKVYESVVSGCKYINGTIIPRPKPKLR